MQQKKGCHSHDSNSTMTARDVAAIHAALAIVQPKEYRLAVLRILEAKHGVDMVTDAMVDVVLDDLAAYRRGLEDGATSQNPSDQI